MMFDQLAFRRKDISDFIERESFANIALSSGMSSLITPSKKLEKKKRDSQSLGSAVKFDLKTFRKEDILRAMSCSIPQVQPLHLAERPRKAQDQEKDTINCQQIAREQVENVSVRFSSSKHKKITNCFQDMFLVLQYR